MREVRMSENTNASRILISQFYTTFIGCYCLDPSVFVDWYCYSGAFGGNVCDCVYVHLPISISPFVRAE